MAHSDSLPPIPPRFVSFAWRYHCAVPVGQVRGRRARPAREIWSTGPFRFMRVEATGPPKFLGIPLSACPALGPRWDRTPGLHGVLMSPSTRCTVSAPTRNSFRGSITRPTDSLSTLRRPGYPGPTQDSLPDGGQPFRAGLAPAGFQRRFRMSCLCCLVDYIVRSSLLLHQAFLAHVGWPRGIAGPRLPQIRTCAIDASGSSVPGVTRQWLSHIMGSLDGGRSSGLRGRRGWGSAAGAACTIPSRVGANWSGDKATSSTFESVGGGRGPGSASFR